MGNFFTFGLSDDGNNLELGSFGNWIFPNTVHRSYMSWMDMIYRIIIDKYTLRFWDICALGTSFFLSLSFYLTYTFTIELFKTIMNQAKPGGSAFAYDTSSIQI